MENLLDECDSTRESANRSQTETELEDESSIDLPLSAETDSTEHTTQEQEAVRQSRRQCGRYSLKVKVRPPDQLRGHRLGRASLKEKLV